MVLMVAAKANLDCGVRFHRHAAVKGHDAIVGLAFGRV